MTLREIRADVEIRKVDAENGLSVMDMALTDTQIAEPMKPQIMTTFRCAAQMLINTL